MSHLVGTSSSSSKKKKKKKNTANNNNNNNDNFQTSLLSSLNNNTKLYDHTSELYDGNIISGSISRELPSTPLSVTSEEESIGNKPIGGGKTIDYYGGVALLVNNVTGAGMVLFAQVYQEAGWLMPTLCLLLLFLTSLAGSLMLIECMTMMHGNEKFQKRVEYTSVMKYYCNRPVFYLISFFYQLALSVSNVSLIIQSVQVMDFAIGAISHHVCLLPSFYPQFQFSCPAPSTTSATAVDSDTYAITLGLYSTALLCVPLGFANLDDNIWVQKGAFILLLCIISTWSVLSVMQGIDTSYVPVLGTTYNNIISTSIFNFAFLTSIPSWINEKQEGVSIRSSLTVSLSISVIMFIILGWLCGDAFSPTIFVDGATLLNAISNLNTILSRITYYSFPIVANLTSIPVTAIFQRYNLVEEKICSPLVANFFAVILPWLIAIPLYQNQGYSELVNWSGVLITSIINFIIPPFVYILALKRQQKELKEREIVLHIHSVKKLNPNTQEENKANNSNSATDKSLNNVVTTNIYTIDNPNSRKTELSIAITKENAHGTSTKLELLSTSLIRKGQIRNNNNSNNSATSESESPTVISSVSASIQKDHQSIKSEMEEIIQENEREEKKEEKEFLESFKRKERKIIRENDDIDREEREENLRENKNYISSIEKYHNHNDEDTMAQEEIRVEEEEEEEEEEELAESDDFVWSAFPPPYSNYRWPMAWIVLATMVALCILALEQQIAQSV